MLADRDPSIVNCIAPFFERFWIKQQRRPLLCKVNIDPSIHPPKIQVKRIDSWTSAFFMKENSTWIVGRRWWRGERTAVFHYLGETFRSADGGDEILVLPPPVGRFLGWFGLFGNVCKKMTRIIIFCGGGGSDWKSGTKRSVFNGFLFNSDLAIEICLKGKRIRRIVTFIWSFENLLINEIKNKKQQQTDPRGVLKRQKKTPPSPPKNHKLTLSAVLEEPCNWNKWKTFYSV